VIWSAGFRALGTSALVAVTRRSRLPDALLLVISELERIDATLSRFRKDSELMQVPEGVSTVVSPLLAEAVSTALDAAAASGGLVDPTVGASLVKLGYDRDYPQLRNGGPGPQPGPAPGWRTIQLDRASRTLRLRPGTVVDLGATGKALAADRAARAAATACRSGVLVNLGGDVAVAGAAPEAGWPVGVADDHHTAPDAVAQTVAIMSGGLATSSVTVRTWRRGDERMHHLIDPRTGRPAAVHWRTATVAADSCVEANTASTAALVAGEDAVERLGRAALAARLVAVDGSVVTLGGWPPQAAA
jgi:FAD:protein FMN transferase